MMLDERAAKRQKVVMVQEDIPDDLVIEILCRLPHHKYVFRCMCISKHWSSLISNPDFICYYITRQRQQLSTPAEQPWAFMYLNRLDISFRYPNRPPTFKLVSNYSEFKSLPLQLHLESQDDDMPNIITIVKGFNDLILCCPEKFVDKSECTYYICNTQTKQWVALPPTPPLPIDLRCSEVEFMCEPYYKMDQHGVVILNPHFKFKVFRFLNHVSSAQGKLIFQVFSSEIGAWNLREISLPIDTIKITRSLVCNDKLTLISQDERTNELTFITIDEDDCHRVFAYPGNKFCVDPYCSIIHVSAPQQGSMRIAQIIINFDGGHNSGIPFLSILDIGNKWKPPHSHIVSFRRITSTDELISRYLRDQCFIVRGTSIPQSGTPTLLGFHPYDDNLLYLDLNWWGPPMVCYNIRDCFLFHVYGSYRSPPYSTRPPRLLPISTRWCWSDVSQLVLPLWPTPLH